MYGPSVVVVGAEVIVVGAEVVVVEVNCAKRVPIVACLTSATMLMACSYRPSSDVILLRSSS